MDKNKVDKNKVDKNKVDKNKVDKNKVDKNNFNSYEGGRSIRTGAVSFFVTLLLFVSMGALSVSLLRMENTISQTRFVLFEADKIGTDNLKITLLNQNIFFDISKKDVVFSGISRIEPILPASIRGLAYALRGVSDIATAAVCELIS